MRNVTVASCWLMVWVVKDFAVAVAGKSLVSLSRIRSAESWLWSYEQICFSNKILLVKCWCFLLPVLKYLPYLCA